MPMYTDRIKRILQAARELAIRNGNSYVGIEHIAESMLREEECVAAVALKGLGIALNDLIEKISGIYEKGNPGNDSMLTMTPRSKKILEKSLAIAQKMSMNYAGTEHLLLALIQETDSVLDPIFKSFNISYDQAEKEIKKILRGEQKTSTRNSVIWSTDEQYALECWHCGSTDKIALIPHRNNQNRIVGIIASCLNCLPAVLGGTIRIIPPEITES